MLVLHANGDLTTTFEILIKTVGARVEWNHNFIVMGDLLVLEGSVRSLLFQFDNRQVVTNLLELEYQQEDVIEISDHPKLANLINIILYVFGKWGTLTGIKVGKDYDQLNTLFRNIFQEYYIEPVYRRENFRFYKDQIRISYEDTFEIAMEAEERPVDEPEELEEEESRGLWHNLIWQKEQRKVRRVQTTLLQRLGNRLGHNFYMVSYMCPKCNEKNLHMVVYPVDHEQRIETEEKGVYIARAYTCDSCNCFYTPRPGRLLIEGDNYEMAFGGDRTAYEDYLELLGQEGQRTSNFKFNEYEALRGKRQAGSLQSPEEAEAQIELYGEELDDLPDYEFEQFVNRVEEGFYPDYLVQKHEPKIQDQILQRQNKGRQVKDKPEQPEQAQPEQASQGIQVPGRSKASHSEEGPVSKDKVEEQDAQPQDHTDADVAERAAGGKTKDYQPSRRPKYTMASGSGSGHYQKHIAGLDQMTDKERGDFRRRISEDSSLNEQEKRSLLNSIEKAEVKKTVKTYEAKTKACEKKSYSQISQVIRELEAEPIAKKYKEPFFKRLFHFRKQKGTEEVKKLMEKVPKHLDRTAYRNLEQKLAEYEGVDMSPYAADLKRRRTEAEKKEISRIIETSPKSRREDYVDLMRQLEEEQFAEENVGPYMDTFKEKLGQMDKERIDKLCSDVDAMDVDEAMAAYEEIADGDFLPELKTNALEQLSKRLEKLKVEECELLVQKLKEDLRGKIKDNPRFHFYPAKRVWKKEAEPGETAVIDHALATYGAGRNLFEYPILVVDTTRNHSGKEGMILTPDHLFYSTMLSAYRIAVPNIAGIRAQTGLLNRKLTLEEKNTAKHKLPYAVDTGEMKTWAKELEKYINYLQERPQSRELKYLAKETHDRICCFRCGCLYQGTTPVCPKCGYKKNK